MAGFPTFVRRKKLVLPDATDQASVWTYDITGSTMYIAADTDEFYVLDISDPASPSYTTRLNIPQPTTTGTHTGAGPTDSALEDSSLAGDDMLWDDDPNMQWANGPTRTAQNLTAETSGNITGNTTNTVTATGVTWNTDDEYQLDNTTSFYLPTTDVLVIGSYLYTCGRNVGQGNPTMPAVGIVASFDISTPQSPIHSNSYRPRSMNPIPVVGASPNEFFGNEWYQGMAFDPADPTKLYLASQLNGLVVLDITDPTDITRAGQYGLTELEADIIGGQFSGQTTTSLYWEASRVAVFIDGSGDRWAALAVHGNGVIALNINTPSAPTDAQWWEAPVENGVRLQARNLVVQGNYLYACHNALNNVDSPERGIIIRDITDPTAIDSDDYFYAAIGSADNDIWNKEGDQPLMGLSVKGDYAYLGNGQRGTAVFDVSRPESPVYIGLQGTNTDPGTNIYEPFVFDYENNTYVYYSDSKEPKETENHNLYADQIYLGGPMAFIIGNKSTAAAGTQLLLESGDRAISSGHLLGRPFLASEGDVVTHLGGTFKEAGGSRTYSIRLHTFDSPLAVPLSPVATGISFVLPADVGAIQFTEQSITNFALTAGTYYCVCASQTAGGGNGNLQGDVTAGFGGRIDDTLTAGVFNATWVTSNTIGNFDPALWALGFNSKSGGGQSVIGSIIGRTK